MTNNDEEKGTPAIGALAARVATLERENRRLRLTGLAALLVVAAVLVMGQAKPAPKAIAAEAFVVRDENGKQIAALHQVSGEPVLAFYDANGKQRGGFAVINQEPALVLYGAHGGRGIMLGLDDQHIPTLSMQDAKGIPRLMVSLGGDAEEAVLSLSDADGTPRAMLAPMGLAVFDTDGKVIYSAP